MCLIYLIFREESRWVGWGWMGFWGGEAGL